MPVGGSQKKEVFEPLDQSERLDDSRQFHDVGGDIGSSQNMGASGAGYAAAYDGRRNDGSDGLDNKFSQLQIVDHEPVVRQFNPPEIIDNVDLSMRFSNQPAANNPYPVVQETDPLLDQKELKESEIYPYQQ